MQFTHVILTRFAVLTRFSIPESRRNRAEWLRYRLDLFEAYCLPGIASQTCQEFEWIVFCDVSTPLWCKRRLLKFRSEAPQLSVAQSTTSSDWYLDAVACARPSDRLLITSRVDSDDGSSVDFVERVQAYAPAFAATGQPVFLLNFPHGYKFHDEDGTVHETWNPHSPHLSMIERLDGPRAATTVQPGNHGLMGERHPLHLDAGPATWLQVIHGGNVSNRMVGADRRVPPSALDHRFVIRPRVEQIKPVAAPQPGGDTDRAVYRQALEDPGFGRPESDEPESGLAAPTRRRAPAGITRRP